MARISRKAQRKLEDLPTLWDAADTSIMSDTHYSRAIDQLRKEQYTPTKPLTRSEIDRHLLENTPRRDELEFLSFGSGSSGNCSYLGIRGIGGVIIDAGIDHKKVIDELERNFIPIDKISGIILTHDHSDHVRYAYAMVKKFPKMRIYCTPRTLTGILRRHSISSRIKDYHTAIFKEFEFEAGPLTITPFEVSHDGSDNVGFSIAASDKRFVVATDMGKITERADHYIRQANYLMIEANYDEHMLTVGSYPDYLKRRIKSGIGHLCNDFTALYLSQIWEPKLTHIYLCHLSQDNNTPEKALSTISRALAAHDISIGDSSGSSESLKADVQLAALPRFESSPHYIFRL